MHRHQELEKGYQRQDKLNSKLVLCQEAPIEKHVRGGMDQGCRFVPYTFSETSNATDGTKPDLNIGETRVWRLDSGPRSITLGMWDWFLNSFSAKNLVPI